MIAWGRAVLWLLGWTRYRCTRCGERITERTVERHYATTHPEVGV